MNAYVPIFSNSIWRPFSGLTNQYLTLYEHCSRGAKILTPDIEKCKLLNRPYACRNIRSQRMNRWELGIKPFFLNKKDCLTGVSVLVFQILLNSINQSHHNEEEGKGVYCLLALFDG